MFHSVKTLHESLGELEYKVNKLKKDDCEVVIFGAGNTSVLYRKCFETEGIKPLFYIDNNKEKQYKDFNGVKILPFDELKKLLNPLVFISSQNFPFISQIEKQLDEMNINHLLVDEYVFAKNSQKILNIADYLFDEISANMYCGVINCRIKSKAIFSEIYDDCQYFSPLPFKSISSSEVFIDMGAYVGDSIELFLMKRMGVFQKIYAFEPDKKNFNAMKKRVARLIDEWALGEDKIECVLGGVGQKTEKLSFSTSNVGMASLGASFCLSLEDNINQSMIYSLDDYLREQKVTFIKADIEGYELDMLKGAQKILLRDTPLLAVCIYHNATDMYSIADYIIGLNIGYKLAIRHHSNSFAETVLYAYKEDMI